VYQSMKPICSAVHKSQGTATTNIDTDNTESQLYSSQEEDKELQGDCKCEKDGQCKICGECGKCNGLECHCGCGRCDKCECEHDILWYAIS